MSPTYDRRLANRISLWVLVAVAIVLAAYFAVELATDPIAAGADSLRVSSLFGFSLPYSEIKEARLYEEPAPRATRISGNDAFGLFREGSYNVDGIGVARVFLKKPSLSYLHIIAGDQDYVLSLGSAVKDRRLFDEIKLKLK